MLNTLELRKQLEECLDKYIDYLEEGGNRILIEEPKHPESELIWSSSLASCPKLHAAERLGLVKKIFPRKDKYRFALANHAALLYKEAVDWYFNENTTPDIASNVWTEYHVRSEVLGVSGTMDIALLNHDWILPVEVKRTDSDRYGGLVAKFVWQTISYIELTNAPAGYLCTLYNGDNETYIRVWRIEPTADGSGWSILDDIDKPMVFQSDDIPHFSEFDPTNFFSREEFDRMRKTHQFWYENYMPDSRPGERSQFHWECAKHKLPEYYKQAYKAASGEKFAKGDKRPSTGSAWGFCPLYGKCYGKELKEAGYDPDNLPTNIPLDYYVDENGFSDLQFEDNPNV